MSIHPTLSPQRATAQRRTPTRCESLPAPIARPAPSATPPAKAPPSRTLAPLASLIHAVGKLNSRITLIVPDAQSDLAKSLVPYEWSTELKVHSLERCLERLHRMDELAAEIGLMVGVRI